MPTLEVLYQSYFQSSKYCTATPNSLEVEAAREILEWDATGKLPDKSIVRRFADNIEQAYAGRFEQVYKTSSSLYLNLAKDCIMLRALAFFIKAV